MKGPNGERRSADVIGCAVQVARIATEEIQDTKLEYPAKRNSGKAGAKARTKALTKSERVAIAEKAAAARWA